MNKTSIARFLRKVGVGSLVDSPVLRRTVGAPLYARHRHPAPALDPASAAPTAATKAEAAHPSAPTPKPKPKEAQPRPAVKDPQLSVIVPVYNVEGFVEETLHSLISQSYEDMEIIVVNDGSTDASLARVENVAKLDNRIRVITKPNGGLGAARNTGLSLASGPFITFVDSDDIVLPGAYRAMMDSIQTTGSDVVIGGVDRTNGTTTWTPAWVNLCHDTDRLGITAMELPEILWDVYAWNKVYRRTSWDAYVGQVPESILYEDQECSGKLYTGGAKLDVLAQTVYRWRLREDGSSITQQKTSMRDLRDRLTVLARMAKLMDEADEEVRNYWYQKVFQDDLYWYYVASPRAEAQYYDELKTGVAQLFDQCPRDSFVRVPLYRRLMTLAIVHGTRADFEAVLLESQQLKSKGQVHRNADDSLALTAPILKQLDFDVAPEMLSVRIEDLEARAILRNVEFLNDGAVHLVGEVFVEGWAYDEEVPGLSARLEREDLGASIAIDISSATPKRGSVDALDALVDPARAGFSLTLPLPETIHAAGAQSEPDANNTWVPVVSLHLGPDLQVETRLTQKDTRGSAGRLVASPTDGAGRRLAPRTLPDGALAYDLIRQAAVVRHAAIEGSRVQLSLDLTGSDLKRQAGLPWLIRARNLSTDAIVETSCQGENGRLEATLNFAARGPKKSNTEDWELDIRRPGLVPHLVGADPNLSSNLGEQFVPVITGYGFLRLRQQFQYGHVERVEVDAANDTVHISGHYFIEPSIRIQTPTFALVSSQSLLRPTRTIIDAATRTFELAFPLTREDADGRPVAVEGGRYVLQILAATKQDLPVSVWLACSSELIRELPSEHRSVNARILAFRTGESQALTVEVLPPFDESEAGMHNQHVLVEKYRSVSQALSPTPLRQAVLFESFAGRAVQDSPLALDAYLAQNRPDMVRLWTVRDHSVAVPQGSVPVVMYSREWYEALATSSHLVNNNNFPHFFTKRPDQVYVQTWHGTPLKRIGNHVPSHSLSLSYRALMVREAEHYWDYLLAQTPWAGTILRDAFNYSGPVLDRGYPRNDALVPSEMAAERRDQVRRHLGLTADQFVVLYAPTWRDTKKDAAGRYKLEVFLNPSQVITAMGAQTAILIRGHANTATGRPATRGFGVFDVTTYPNVNDLMLAADVLVTDYSSMMFDFVVTGKPMVFLTPDLATYRDQVRGFYVDFESIAPGPIRTSTADVIKDLVEIRDGNVRRSQEYAAFHQWFAHLDDGKAAERVGRAVWGKQ